MWDLTVVYRTRFWAMGKVSDYFEHDLDVIEDLEKFGPERDATPHSTANSRCQARESQKLQPKKDSKGERHDV